MKKKLEAVVMSLPLLLGGCSLSLVKDEKYEYAEKVNSKVEPLLVSPLIILKFNEYSEKEKK